VPAEYDVPGYFRHVSREGLASRFEELKRTGHKVDEEAYKKRL
jgi:hypothetical protein